MPSRNKLRPSVVLQKSNATITQYALPYMIGVSQSISALNNAGTFVPGVFRANPVVLERVVTTSVPAKLYTKKYGATTYGFEGDIAAYLAYLYTNPSVYPGQVSAWNATAAGGALTKAYAAMNGPDLDVGVMLGELGETIEGLRNPLSALRKYVAMHNKLQKRASTYKRGVERLNALSGSWLEFRYGIMPLIYSIQDIMAEIEAKSLASVGKMLRKREKVKPKKQEFQISGSTMPGFLSITGKAQVCVETTYTSVVTYKLLQPLTWQERYGLDASNLPSIAWELAKLSFVWDWFLGIGDWLGSLATSDKRQVLGSVTSQKSIVTVEWPSPQVTLLGEKAPSHSTFSLTYSKLDRRVNQGLPALPAINTSALSLKRTIDGVSLLWQQMPKFKR